MDAASEFAKYQTQLGNGICCDEEETLRLSGQRPESGVTADMRSRTTKTLRNGALVLAQSTEKPHNEGFFLRMINPAWSTREWRVR
jgi:hypothetical protein